MKSGPINQCFPIQNIESFAKIQFFLNFLRFCEINNKNPEDQIVQTCIKCCNQIICLNKQIQYKTTDINVWQNLVVIYLLYILHQMKSVVIGTALCATMSLGFKIQTETENAVMVADPQQCIEEKCPNQWAACQKDSKCIPALQDCEKKCGTKQSCWQFCLPSKGSSAAIDVAKCAAANHCLGMAQVEVEETEVSTALMVADPQQCIEEKCPNQWAACQKDSKCIPALQDCEKKCGTKQSCWQFCLPSKGSSAAIDVAKCAAANKCLGVAQVEVEEAEVSTALMVADPQQCIQEKCPNQWAACQKDSKCLPALQDCEKKCGTKQSCWQFCLPSKGSSAAIDVAKCAAANNCLQALLPEAEKSTALMVADPQQCIEEKCPNQWAACQKDSKCIPALQDCEKKCGTKQSCWQFCLPSKGSSAAIDVAKCAAANNCLKAPMFPYAFETCMSKTCASSFSECLADESCRSDLRVCKNVDKIWDFSFECLAIKSDFNEKLKTFFHCAGESKCI